MFTDPLVNSSTGFSIILIFYIKNLFKNIWFQDNNCGSHSAGKIWGYFHFMVTSYFWFFLIHCGVSY